jgi:hypothetical protein
MEINSYHTPYIELANRELNWLPMDSEDRYKENLKYKPDVLKRYGWLDSKFTYKFNSQGFRCDEFTSEPSIVFLGCSMTVGIGLPIETTWPSIVSEKLNFKCYNLGIGGSSNDTAFRLAYHWLEKLKPKIVVLCQTYPSRMEIFSDNKIIADPATEISEFYLKHWTKNFYNLDLLRSKNVLAINKLSDMIDAKFVKVSVDNFQPFSDFARDLAHPGVQSNIKLSNLVLSKIE